MEERTCPQCGKRFLVAPRVVRGRPRTFCNPQCRRAREQARRRARRAAEHEAYLRSLPPEAQEFWRSITDGAEMAAGLVEGTELLDRLAAAGNAALEELLRGKG